MSRKAIGKRRRFDVFKRDGFKCQYCGAHPPQAVLEVDHIEPVALGGGNEIDNLTTACFNCNRGKAANSLADIPQSLADRASLTAEAEAQLAGYQAIMRARLDRIDADAWAAVAAFEGVKRVEEYSSRDLESFRMFIVKIGFDRVIEAVHLTNRQKLYGRSRFRYFCGCCWRMAREESGDQ